MDLNLKGKRALVTGSSSGIGASIAELLAAEGVRVVVHGRDADRARSVADGITRQGGEAIVAIGDLATKKGADSILDTALSHFGKIDILVNNAGGSTDVTLTWDNSSPEQWTENYETNTVSAVRMIQGCLPGMKESHWGRIIQVSSTGALFPMPMAVPSYFAAKAAILTMTVSLAKTLADTGVTVNTVSPGPVVTKVMRDYMLSLPANEGKRWEDIEPTVARDWHVLVGRMGRPQDLGALITFLASPLADFITGANYRCDGGLCGFIN